MKNLDTGEKLPNNEFTQLTNDVVLYFQFPSASLPPVFMHAPRHTLLTPSHYPKGVNYLPTTSQLPHER